MKIFAEENGLMTMEAENQAEQFQLINLKLALPRGHCVGINGSERTCYTLKTVLVPTFEIACSGEPQ